MLFSVPDPLMKITRITALLIKIDTCLIQARKMKSAAGQVVARYNYFTRVSQCCAIIGTYDHCISVVKHTIIKLLA